MISGPLVFLILMVAGLFVALVLAIGGAVLTYRGFTARSQGSVTAEWPFTTGIIEESTVRAVTMTDSLGQTVTEYLPYVRYSYEAGGKRYTGSHLSPGLINTGAGEEAARKLASQYPIGSSVTVWYDPADPLRATVERRSGTSGVNLALGIILLVVGLSLVCLFFPVALFSLIPVF